MRMPPDDSMEDSDYVQNTIFFDDGGMRGLACALVWCGLIHHAMSLKDEDLTNPSMAELARSMLAIPIFHRSNAADESTAMIRRIIKQNVEAKKQAVSSYEWSLILKSLGSGSNKGKELTVQAALEMYNSNPEVAAHGTAKDCLLSVAFSWVTWKPVSNMAIMCCDGLKGSTFCHGFS